MSDRQLVTILLLAIGALVVLPGLFMGGGMMGYGPMMRYGPMMGGPWGGGGQVPGWMVLFGAAMQLLFLAVLVGAGYLLYRAVTRDRTDGAIAELRAAYARGDLSDEEYERRRDVLEREP